MKRKGKGGTGQGQKGKRGRGRHSLKYVNCPGGRNEDTTAPRSWGCRVRLIPPDMSIRKAQSPSPGETSEARTGNQGPRPAHCPQTAKKQRPQLRNTSPTKADKLSSAFEEREWGEGSTNTGSALSSARQTPVCRLRQVGTSRFQG